MTKTFWIIPGLVLSLSAFFLFCRLGHYALWDDESFVGLAAQGVLKTGDTSALLDHNIVAYEDGLLLINFRDRSTPPFPAYLTAASFALFGKSAWAARLPFALSGWLCIGLMLHWAFKEKVRLPVLILLGIAILGNVSLFLFCRQCRYYGVAIFCTTAIAYLYLNWGGKPRRLAALVGFSLVLLASNYIEFVALYLCLIFDYAVWGRKERALTSANWLLLMLPQLVVGATIVLIWNSAATGSNKFMAISLADRLHYVWWFVRDLNMCEFGLIWLLAVAPLLYQWRRNPWLIRLPAALGLYLVTVALLCPLKSAVVSEIRYLSPCIPAWIALGVLVLGELGRSRSWLPAAAGLLCFWTNMANANWLIPFPYLAAGWKTPYPFSKTDLRSTLLLYTRELLAPPPDPYTVAADWINQNMAPGQSVWVAPGYSAYPLMFLAPKVIYAWQLSYPPKPPYRYLPEIYFLGRQPPDLMIGFAGWVQPIRNVLKQMQDAGIHYREQPSLACFGRDAYRPELYRRTFQPITGFDPQTEGIYIFQRR
jgi:4-amino-4-deoxy-L-arabinose transferase-like glycosyltransferase